MSFHVQEIAICSKFYIVKISLMLCNDKNQKENKNYKKTVAILASLALTGSVLIGGILQKMRKQTVIFIQAMMVMAIVSGCRSNPTAMATNENGVMQEEQEIITDAGSDNALEEVPERLVWSYESLNGIKNLDIPIERTNQKLLCGKVQRKKKSPEIICNVLEPESLWSQDKELAQETKADDVYQTEITTGLDRIYQDSYLYFDEGTYFYSKTIRG